MPVATPKALDLRKRAERLASPYPNLLAAAERVAAVVTQGVHGRRRAGQGETFWEYRNYHSSDAANRIDWRRSARGQQLYVRENEWEAANTVYFWRDGGPGMNWQSSSKVPTKIDRASILSMSLAILLSARPAKGILIHIIDPAERDFPFKGRVKLRFPGLSKLEPLLVGRAEQARENYREKFDAHCASIAQLARRLDWPLIVHETDKPANAALTAAYIAMSGDAL